MNQNKYVVRLSFIILFLNIIINIMLYRYFMIKDVIINHAAAENVQIAEFYTKHIWNPNKKITDKLHHTSYEELLQNLEFIHFITTSTTWFTNFNSNISLYSFKGDQIVSNCLLNTRKVQKYEDDNIFSVIMTKIDNFFLKSFITTTGFNSAFSGTTAHVLSPKVLIKQGNTEEKASFITSYIPIIDGNLYDFPVDAVLEINTDITAQWTNILALEKKVFFTFIIIFVIFCVILISNTNYARRIIEEQFTTNRNLKTEITQVEQTSSANTKFFANISHELRTPLNAIIGFSEILMTEKNIEKNMNYVKDINSAGKHLLSMINDILDLSKASADKLKVDNIDLDLNKLVSSSITLVKPRADRGEISIINELPKEHIVIKADPKRLKQVFLNLFSNAIKFTNPGGSVTITANQNEEEKLVYIQIIDTGIGIAEKDIPKTLSAFEQIDSALNKKYEGTGLGLPLTKKLVELMGGKFDLKSEINKGTVVTLTFTYVSSIEI